MNRTDHNIKIIEGNQKMNPKENVINKKIPWQINVRGLKIINNQIKTFLKNDDTPTFKWLFYIC